MDALAEVSAFPRILAPDTHKQEFDLRACGITYYDSSNPAAVPREWATQGKYDVGKDRSEQRRQIIRECYHVDLFRMFAELDKQMTAREVAERSAEKINQFTATFTRLTTELFTPMLQRIFRLAYRAGILPPVPRELIVPGARRRGLDAAAGGLLLEPNRPRDQVARELELLPSRRDVDALLPVPA